MRTAQLCLVIWVGLPLLSGADSALPQLPADQVVARVNGTELRGAVLNDYLEVFLPNFTFHGKVQPEKINTYRQQALERMILHELIYQDALRRRIRIPTSQIEAEIARTRGRYRSQAAFEKAVAKRGLTIKGLRSVAEHNLLVAEVVRRDITNRTRVTDVEVRAYYRKNLARFREPESVQVRHIFIPPGLGADRQAREVRQKALDKNTSEEFDRLAREYSKDDYRVMGGMLGWVHRGTLEPELEKAAFALRPGEVSPVIATSTGFHVLRVEGKRSERQVPLRGVQEKIRSQLAEARAKQLREELRARLYKNAKVEVLTRF